MLAMKFIVCCYSIFISIASIFTIRYVSSCKLETNSYSFSQDSSTMHEHITDFDRSMMRKALAMALKARGKTRPNPLVGCIITNSFGLVLGYGWHEACGEAHAEVHALKMAGKLARGATAYVSLEPCSHYGRTPPCTQALIKSGIRRVVTGMVDPDARVSGRGISCLISEGIKVDIMDGKEHELCLNVNAPYIFRVRNGIPYCSLVKIDPMSWQRSNHETILHLPSYQNKIFRSKEIFDEYHQSIADLDTAFFQLNVTNFDRMNESSEFAWINNVIDNILPPYMNIVIHISDDSGVSSDSVAIKLNNLFSSVKSLQRRNQNDYSKRRLILSTSSAILLQQFNDAINENVTIWNLSSLQDSSTSYLSDIVTRCCKELGSNGVALFQTKSSNFDTEISIQRVINIY